MKTTKREQKLRILSEVPIDLHTRAVAYARRMRISEADLIELAMSESFISNLEEWQRALSAIVELAVSNYLELRSGDLVAGGEVSLAKQNTEAIDRWNLLSDLHVRAVAYASYLGIPYDELLEVALRSCFTNPSMPSSWHQALATLVKLALNDYLRTRQRPAHPEADRTAARRLRH